MTREEAIGVLSCWYEPGDTRQNKALDMAIKALTGYDWLKDEIADYKRRIIHSGIKNRDYVTGYLCALSNVEGMIAEVEGENG